MKFNVSYSYNLDVLNFINILTRAELYLAWHKGIYEQWGEKLSCKSKECITKAIEIKSNTMFGPLLSLVISAVPNFEKRSLVRMFSDPDMLKSYFSNYQYYDAENWLEEATIFELLIPIIKDLEALRFHDYWKKERLPIIKKIQRQFRTIANQCELDSEIELMLGKGNSPEDITVYLCSFSAPHGIKICGPRYITDIKFPMEVSLGIAVHELFHPPYNAKNLIIELQSLENDPLLQHAFKTKDPRFGYPTMPGFIEENVVEAMALSVCHKVGLEKDPIGYLKKHDEGSHMLSVVLFDYFGRFPKPRNQSFETYFVNLLKKMPVGSLDREYHAIMQR